MSVSLLETITRGCGQYSPYKLLDLIFRYMFYNTLIFCNSWYHAYQTTIQYFAIFPQFNPLSANPRKWSNPLKHFVDNNRRIV